MEPLTPNILALMYFGDAIFAMSGALAAGRHRMDIMGFILIGTITGIGGGTLRDLLLGRTVWWTENPLELLLCVGVSVVTFFAVSEKVARRAWVNWSDALGLSAFAVIGCHIALTTGPHPWSWRSWPASWSVRQPYFSTCAWALPESSFASGHAIELTKHLKIRRNDYETHRLHSH